MSEPAPSTDLRLSYLARMKARARRCIAEYPAIVSAAPHVSAVELLALVECAEALKELSGMYSSAWDRVDGALVMMDTGVVRFETAHGKAFKALEKLEAL